jgi:hypothetical protein
LLPILNAHVNFNAGGLAVRVGWHACDEIHKVLACT